VRADPSFHWRRVLLVGFMGSGKSAVGQALADSLGWDFRDFDRVAEERAGKPVSRIFAEDGEARFRELEDHVGRELLELERVVLATGGGWPCVPGRMEGLDRETLAVWLRVDPETAVARSRRSRAGRPLLAVSDPLARARELLELRRPYYEKAHWSVDGEAGAPERVAARLADRLRTNPERPLRD
jgi:shikimate kinase